MADYWDIPDLLRIDREFVAVAYLAIGVMGPWGVGMLLEGRVLDGLGMLALWLILARALTAYCAGKGWVRRKFSIALFALISGGGSLMLLLKRL